MKSIVSLFKDQVNLTLKAAMQRKAELLSQKQSDRSSTIKKYQKMLEDFDKELDENQKEFEDFKKLFVTAAVDKPVALKKQLEERIACFKEAVEIRDRIGAAIVDATNRLADTPLEKELRANFKERGDIAKDHVKKQEQFLSDLVKKLCPARLKDKHKDFAPVKEWVDDQLKDIKKINKKAEVDWDNSKYSAGISGDAIRWARYIPLKNIPTVDDTEKGLSMYLVICITFLATKEFKNKMGELRIGASNEESISKYSATITSKFTNPFDISLLLYKADDPKQLTRIISHCAAKHHMYGFGEEIKGTVEERLDRITSKLYILNKEGVVINKKKNFITVKVPTTLVNSMGGSNAAKNGTWPVDPGLSKFDMNLQMDVRRFLGMAVGGGKNTTALHPEKKWVEGEYTCFMFRQVPINTDYLRKDDAGLKHGTATKSPAMPSADMEDYTYDQEVRDTLSKHGDNYYRNIIEKGGWL